MEVNFPLAKLNRRITTLGNKLRKKSWNFEDTLASDEAIMYLRNWLDEVEEELLRREFPHEN